MGVKSVGNGIKTRLENISGLRVFAPNELPDSVNQLPCALIQHVGTDYDQSMGGLQHHTFKVKVLVTRQDMPSALNSILDYVENTGSESIREQIENDVTLDSSADTSMVRSNTGQGGFVWGGIAYLGTEFEIEAWE